MIQRRILLAVSTSRYSQHLVTHAVNEAQRLSADGDAVLIDVLNILEREELDRVSDMVGDAGFLGLDPQAGVLAALGKEHARQAELRVDEVRAAAATAGIEVRVHRVDGRFADQVIAYAHQLGSEIILITRADRPFISRILFGSEADKITRIARRDGLGKVIIDEDD